MADETKSALQKLRKTFKGRLSPIKPFDCNVCEARTPPGRPWELIPVIGQLFYRQLRFTYKKHKVVLVENDSYVSGRVMGEFPGRILSVNFKNALRRLWISAGEVKTGARRCPLFTQDGKLTEYEDSLIRRAEFTALLAELDFKNGGSLHFSGGDVHFYMQAPTAERVQRVIERMVDLAEKIEVVEEQLDLTQLPVRFHPLIPLIKKWAVSDDGDREDLLSTASKAAMKKMVETVSPYFNEIGSYLDSFGEKPPPEAVCALGTLAECFMEAEMEITKAAKT